MGVSSRATFLDSCLFFPSRIGNEEPGIFQKLTPRRAVNRKSGISRQREELESSFKAHFVGLVAGNIFGFVSFFPISHRKRGTRHFSEIDSSSSRKSKKWHISATGRARKLIQSSFCRSRGGQHFWIRVFFSHLA